MWQMKREWDRESIPTREVQQVGSMRKRKICKLWILLKLFHSEVPLSTFHFGSWHTTVPFNFSLKLHVHVCTCTSPSFEWWQTIQGYYVTGGTRKLCSKLMNKYMYLYVNCRVVFHLIIHTPEFSLQTWQ